MITIALFNNKGGVGKTTLTFHVANMLTHFKQNTLIVDLDPQANLTSAFLEEEELEALWATPGKTILTAVNPILEGIGDIAQIEPIRISQYLSLIGGDLGLSRFEDKLSESWAKGFGGDPAALRVTSAFFRIIRGIGSSMGTDIVLMDVGPNLGAINRAALLAADFLLIPLAADLYSLQGLRNLGPTVRQWRSDWLRTLDYAKQKVGFPLPSGLMTPLGYVVLQHAVRLDRPVKAYAKWLQRIPGEYRRSVLLQDPDSSIETVATDEDCLATIRNYRSLMPMAQDARKPMFSLKPADGAIGSHAQLVQTCFDEFQALTRELLERCGALASREQDRLAANRLFRF